MVDNAGRLQAQRQNITPPATERDRGSPAKIAAGVEQRQQARIAQEANAEWQRFAASPEGKATLLRKRNEFQDKLESQRAQARGGLTSAQLAQQSRSQVYQTYIVAYTKSANEEQDRRVSARIASENRNNRVTGTQGAAAKPAPKTVIEDRLKGEGVNTNVNQEFTTADKDFTLTRKQGQSFNIGRFRAEVSGADSVLPTHSFLVVFAPMPWALKKFPKAGSLDSLLTMRCDNVVLPSINLLQEQNIRRYGFGPVENVAYGVNVGDFTLQFIVDKQALVVEFFEAWLNRIVNRDSYGGADMNSADSSGRTPYEIAYKDTYACSSVNVFVYDRSQNNVMEYNIYDVFPTGIQSMNMSWSEENTLMKLNITFSFTDLRIRQSEAKNKQDAAFSDEIKVTASGYPFSTPTGNTFATLDPTGARGLELTDLSNETTIIGDFAGRIRGSVPSTFDPTFGGSTPLPEIPATTLRILTGESN